MEAGIAVYNRHSTVMLVSHNLLNSSCTKAKRASAQSINEESVANRHEMVTSPILLELAAPISVGGPQCGTAIHSATIIRRHMLFMPAQLRSQIDQVPRSCPTSQPAPASTRSGRLGRTSVQQLEVTHDAVHHTGCCWPDNQHDVLRRPRHPRIAHQESRYACTHPQQSSVLLLQSIQRQIRSRIIRHVSCCRRKIAQQQTKAVHTAPLQTMPAGAAGEGCRHPHHLLS